MEAASTRPTARLEHLGRAGLVGALCALIFAGCLQLSPLWAQADEPAPETTPAATDIPAEDRLQQIREEMTATLSRLEAVQRELQSREQVLEQARSVFAAATESGDSEEIQSAQRSLSVAEEAVASVREDIATEQLLYDRAAERFRIAQEQASLAATEASASDSTGLALMETIQRRDQVNQAAQEASLATQRVESLRAEIEILESRQERIRRDSDQINQWLDEGRQLDRSSRSRIDPVVRTGQSSPGFCILKTIAATAPPRSGATR